MARKLVAVVTGSNRGIGLAIVTQLAQCRSPTPLLIYATSRSGADLGITASASNEVRYAPLDITRADSIDGLVARLDRVDILVNNAGVNLDADYSAANAERTFAVNYRGTLAACRAFLRVMPSNGDGGPSGSSSSSRIVNVTSGACQLGNYASAIQQRFRSAGMTLGALDALAREYLEAVRAGREEESGWRHVGASYSVSKSCVTALTAVLAREHPGVLINCCCPGWVRTDMGGQVGEGGKSPEEGARIPVRLAIGDIGNVSGRYWANDGVQNTGSGEVQDW